MTTNETKKLTNATVEIYYAAAGENPDLRFQVRATHTSMGAVQLCYTSKTDADNAAKFINEFGVCPPSPTAESERRAQLEAEIDAEENRHHQRHDAEPNGRSGLSFTHARLGEV